jgi:hypothetical protein
MIILYKRCKSCVFCEFFEDFLRIFLKKSSKIKILRGDHCLQNQQTVGVRHEILIHLRREFSCGFQ